MNAIRSAIYYLKQILGKFSTYPKPAPCHVTSARLARCGAFFCMSLMLVQAGCEAGEPSAIRLQEIAYPTGIDYWPSRKTVLFGDYAGNIYGMQESGARVTKLMAVGTTDCARILRLRIDALRNRLWVMSASGVCIYDLQSLRLARHVPLGDMSRYRPANGLTDIALDTEGHAYAIDTGIDPIVYRIEAATLAVTAWNKTLPPNGVAVYSPRHFPLNAISVTPDGARLLYFNAYKGTLHALNIKDRQSSAILLPQPIYAVNALVTAPSAARNGGTDLYALSAKNNAVTIIDMDGDAAAARVRAHATALLDNPLAGTLVQGVLFVTNSQLLQHPEINGDSDTRRPSSIVRLTPAYFLKQASNPALGSIPGQ